MRFPKSLVIFGFFMIAAGIGAGIYDAVREKGPVEPHVDMQKMAQRSTDAIFEKLFKPFNNLDSVSEEFLNNFKIQEEGGGITAIADRASRLMGEKDASAAAVLQIEKDLYDKWEKKLHRKILFEGLLSEEDLTKILSQDQTISETLNTE